MVTLRELPERLSKSIHFVLPKSWQATEEEQARGKADSTTIPAVEISTELATDTTRNDRRPSGMFLRGDIYLVWAIFVSVLILKLNGIGHRHIELRVAEPPKEFLE